RHEWNSCPSQNPARDEVFGQPLELVPCPSPNRRGAEFFRNVWRSYTSRNGRETEVAAGSGQNSAA
ncbi:MAG: hypothetical protein WAK29_21170, partial [Terriglobales bacterium]